MRPIICAILAALIPSALFGAESIIQVPNTAENQRLIQKMDLDHDCMGSTRKHLRFLMDDHARSQLAKNSVMEAQLMAEATVAEENVLSQFASVAKEKDLGIYHTFGEMEDELHGVAKEYPNLATLSVGKRSFEDRPIYVMELTAKSSKAKKVNYLVTGTHHAREWISTEVALEWIQHLVKGYGKDSKVTTLLDTSVFVVVPMLNPDGGVHSRIREWMWRKNRRKAKKALFRGVDNNRNYPHMFGGGGSSGFSASQTYRGEEPLTEAENQLVIELTEKYKFTASVSLHSYGELVIWPWGYTYAVASNDHVVFEKYGNEMGRIMGHKPMQASGLYIASGVYEDTLYANYGVLAYTFELGREFIPKPEKVEGIEAKSIEAMQYLFINARDPFGGVEETQVRKAQRFLQKLVYHMSLPENKRELSSDYASLSSFSNEVIEEAMEGIKMIPQYREKIRSGMARHHKHSEIHVLN